MRAAGVDFVVLTDLPPSKHITGRISSRFKGPSDPNYACFVEQIKRLLVLRASTEFSNEELLTQCIDEGYNLGVKTHAKRCPLTLAVLALNTAAVARLVSARPSLVIEQDTIGATPLHWALDRIMKYDSIEIEPYKGTYKMIVEKLLSAEYDDDIKDHAGKSAWYYISAAAERSGTDFQWVHDLRENKFLFNGARAAQPEIIEDANDRVTAAQRETCRTLNATLAQFYISNDDTSDYLEFQRPNIEALVYHRDYGVNKLFERNLRHDDDKRATCRWVHLPANNVSEHCRKRFSRRLP